ncbi:hypothetical protein WAI453_012520 [Rhynchosporium graminicola]
MGRAERMKRTLPHGRRNDIHEAYALQKYSSALSDIRQYLARTRIPDPKMFLMAGLLKFLFEFQQGNRTLATKRLRTTLALFKNLRFVKSEGYTDIHRLAYSSTFEEAVIEMVIRLQII